MSFSDYFPIFGKLTGDEQALLTSSAVLRKIKKGTVLYNGEDCLGLLVIRSGQIRAFIPSEQGREITLYRLLDGDICLFSASCMIKSMQLNVAISAEKDTEAWLIPLKLYQSLMERSAVVANYTNEIMGARLTDVMWLIEQIIWRSLDKRLAEFLIGECAIEQADILKITHEQIAAHLGTAREVITRMLKYFQTEGVVKLTRGTVEVINRKKLYNMSK